MKKRTLIRIMLGLVLIVSLIGCQTVAKEEPVKTEVEVTAEKVTVEESPVSVEEVKEEAKAEEVVAEEPSAPVEDTAVVEKAVEEVAVVEETAAEEAVVKEAIAEEAAAKKDVHIKLIETSDMHGSLFPYDFINDRPTKTSLAQIYSYVEQERAKDQEVVLLDNGDVLQGQPIVYYYNFEKTDSEHIVASVMNAMGYDAATVGNHDVEAGPDVYIKVAMESNFPWLAANAVSEKTGKPFTQPYAVINRDGIKIVVFGMITPGVPNWLPKNLYEGVVFEDMVDTAKKWVPIIEAKEKPDVLVGLFHSGVDAEYGGYTADDPCNPNASLLVAQQVPGFDVIFTGHDHKDTHLVVKNSEGEDVHVLGAMNAARSVATADITFTWDEASDSYVMADLTSETVMMDSYPVSQEAMDTFGYAMEEVKEWVSRPIGEITETISTHDAMFGDSKFVDLIHRLQLELTGADISFAAPLSLSATIKKGPVYVRDMFNLYKYENLLYTMELTGAEIDAFLEYSYGNWFNQMKSIDDHIIKFKTDSDGNLIFNERYNSYETATRYYNWDSAAGIRYVVDLRKPAGDRVTIKTTTKDGLKFDMNKTYTVAINSYRGNGGGGHLTKGVGLSKEEIAERTLTSTVADLRYYFIKGFEMLGTVTPEVDNNWFASPIMWAKRGMEQDAPLLFGE